jgi:hypothetical protein
MGRDVKTEEETRIRERRGRDDVLPGDVDAREADRRQAADDDQE